MARVTVEDCIEKVTNRFDLVLLAGQRARAISAGAQLTVDRDNDKNPVVALREIADETVSVDTLEEELIQSLQRHVEIDEPEDEEIEQIEAANTVQAEEEGEAPNPEQEVAEDVLNVQEDAVAAETEAEAAVTEGEDQGEEPKQD